jgi:hypothetical protein
VEVNVKKWDKIINSSIQSLPKFGYHLADYDEIPIMTMAPVHAGDFLQIKEDEDSKPIKRKVKEVVFLETTVNVGDGLYTPFIYFED